MKMILNVCYYSAKDTAMILGLSVKTIRRYYHKGLIHARHIGNEWYCTESEIKDFLSAENITAVKTKAPRTYTAYLFHNGNYDIISQDKNFSKVQNDLITAMLTNTNGKASYNNGTVSISGVALYKAIDVNTFELNPEQSHGCYIADEYTNETLSGYYAIDGTVYEYH